MFKGQTKPSKYINSFKLYQIFGEYKVIDTTIYKDKKGRTRITVKCSCGNTKLVEIFTLLKGQATKCYRCNRKSGKENHTWKGFEEIPGSWLSRTKRGAIKRNIQFNLCLEDVWNQYLKQNKKCNLTNLSISFKDKTASVDRINSNKGYEPNNIQIVHKDINLMKNYFDQDYYIAMCKLVSENASGHCER